MKEKVLVIVGPTAVGKTALSIDLAKKYQGSIISGDALQVYRKLNVGTAKITPSEMAGIAHYLIDIREIDQSFSAYDFQIEAGRLINQLTNQKKLPMVVGGTGFYLKALFRELPMGSDHTEAIQQSADKWQTFLSQHDQLSLFDALKEIDPDAAAKIPVSNTRRLIRALSVSEGSGQLFSKQGEGNDFDRYDLLVIGLNTDRKLLYERINQRVDLMVETGLLNEARMLYDLPNHNIQSSKGIGYKEFFPFFAGEQTLDESIELVKLHSRRYAKRQLTWFRNQLAVQWFDLIQAPSEINQIHSIVEQWLNK